MKRDNSTYAYKRALRRNALARLAEAGIEQPVIMETHGGTGAIFAGCYSHLENGVVFETNPTKVARLGLQRPTWAVYEADCIEALKGGVGAHVTVELLDIDPYGDPWPAVEAFFSSTRPFAPLMAVAVNDGLRNALSMGRAWDIGSLRPIVERYGNDLHPIYLDVCAELMNQKVAAAAYRVDHFAGYYCGKLKAMTHYLAVLRC